MHAGDPSWPNKAILLHGCPSCNLEFLHHLPAYMYMNYQVFAIDLPGYGKSTGKPQASRSEKILDEGGPAEVVKIVMKELQIKKPVLGGYDWGAAIALKMAVEKSSNFSKIIAFHPSYNEDKKDELKSIKCPTLIQWVK